MTPIFKTSPLHKVRVTSKDDPIVGDVAVLFADKSGRLLPNSTTLAKQLGATDLNGYLKLCGFDGKLGTVVHSAAGQQALLIVGIGNNKKITDTSLRKLGSIVSRKLTTGKFRFATVAMESFTKNTLENARSFLTGMQTATYTFTDLKTTAKPAARPAEIRLVGQELNRRQTAPMIAEVDAAVSGSHLTRRLIDLPPDIITTETLKGVAESLAKEHPQIKVQVYDRAALTTMGMNLFLAVSQGSDQPPYMVQLTYQGSKKAPLVDLVGKGLVYDTGGMNLKTGDHMAGMKTDMAGTATVLGILHAAAQMNAPINVRGTLCIVENATGPKAVRPDEVRYAYNGTTVEITDTDAEGRLVLYDALAFVKDQGAQTILDFATLTGSIVRALGSSFAGLFCNSTSMSTNLLGSAVHTGEGLWAMPLVEATRYEEALASNVADLRNWQQGDVPDAIGAALFLQHAVKTRKKGGPRGRLRTPDYAHLDIAGTADGSVDAAGEVTKKFCATGYGVRTILHYLITHHTK